MKKELKILAVIATVVVIAAMLGMRYYRNSAGAPVITNKNSNSTVPSINPEALARPDSPTLGPADAKVTVVEFLDPECESCAAFGPTVKKLVNQAGQTRLVVRYMNFHPNSNRAATFLEYAREKGKFWETLDLLFQKQSEWGERHGASPSAQADVPKVFEKFAGQLGFDWTVIHSAYKENKYRQIFDRDMADGRSIGVRQTPTIFVNGRRLLSLTESDLKMLIDAELAK